MLPVLYHHNAWSRFFLNALSKELPEPECDDGEGLRKCSLDVVKRCFVVLGLIYILLLPHAFLPVWALPQGYATGALRYTHVGLDAQEQDRPRSDKLIRSLTPPDLQEALTALVHDPYNIEKRLLVAYRYYQAQRWADAQREALKASLVYKRLYPSRPMHPMICLILGAVHRERGQLKESELYLLDAIDQFSPETPQYSEALYELGKTYTSLHEQDKAMVLLKKHVGLSPHHAEGWEALAQAYQAHG
ncbi:MAG: tetratricopeptide repeat protein, partial [Vampirovibrionales bacterium]